MVHYLHGNLPFGGVNTSGLGRAHGHYGFREFSHERAVVRNRYQIASLFYPPYTNFTRRIGALQKTGEFGRQQRCQDQALRVGGGAARTQRIERGVEIGDDLLGCRRRQHRRRCRSNLRCGLAAASGEQARGDEG